MFATWKYNYDTAEVQNVCLAFDPNSATSSKHQACDRCRGKKLKCSGKKDGCDRCIAGAYPCVYSRSASGCSRRDKRDSRCSTDNTAFGDMLSQSTGNLGPISRRSTRPQQHPHRVLKGSQSRRKSTWSSAAQSRSSTEPDALNAASQRTSASSSSAGSPGIFLSHATISVSGDNSAATSFTSLYEPSGAISMSQQQHNLYSMIYHDCGYQSSTAWPAHDPRDPPSSARMSNHFTANVSNPTAIPVPTLLEDYMHVQADSNLQLYS